MYIELYGYNVIIITIIIIWQVFVHYLPLCIINTDKRVRLDPRIVVVALHSSYYDDMSICVSCWWQMISSPVAPAQQ